MKKTLIPIEHLEYELMLLTGQLDIPSSTNLRTGDKFTAVEVENGNPTGRKINLNIFFALKEEHCTEDCITCQVWNESMKCYPKNIEESEEEDEY